MHEMSIAMSIAEAASEEALKQGGAKVCAVYLRLGELSGVMKEALLFSWDASCEGTDLAGAQLVIEDVPVIVFCETCGADRRLKSIQLFVCPECGAPVSRVLGGKDMEVTALELEE